MFSRSSRWFCLLPLLGACVDVSGPRLPEDAEPFDPPAIYQPWWQLTEACVGRRADFHAVRWYVMRGVDRLPGRQGVVGAWMPGGNRIVLAEHALSDGMLVRHEMLHAMLGAAGADHPREEFVGACGGVVACSGACEDEAGPATAQAPAARIEPSALAVDVTVFPSRPSATVYAGHYYLLVTATHTGAVPVEVELPGAGVDGLRIGPDYEVRGDGAPITAWAPVRHPEAARFAPGETKRFVFDFRVGARNQYGQVIPNGTWTFHGAYGGQWAAESPVVTIGP